MPFKEVERVKFKNNSLTNVICQLRFPTILEIEKEVPSNFQNLIAGRFFDVNIALDMPEPVDMRFDVGQQISFGVSLNRVQQPRKNYCFYSSDSNYVVNLTRNFLSLSTQNYDRWENFREVMKYVLDAFVKVYEERDLTRVGLRYINAISKRKLNFPEDTQWSELINPYLLGIMGDTKLGQCVKGINSTTLLNCVGESINMQIQCGIFAKMEDTSEEVFLIDTDTFSTKKNTTDTVMNLLENLHEKPRRFLHYAIRDKLYRAMEPERI